MDRTYRRQLETLHSHFEESFLAPYRKLGRHQQAAARKALHAIYRKWYHSPLTEAMFFSPSCIASAIGEGRGANAEVCTFPVFPAKQGSIGMRVAEFSCESHPIIADMEVVVGYCSPHIDIHLSGNLTIRQAEEMAAGLSIRDDFYSSYLFDTAVWLGLLAKLPSLHIKRYGVTEKWDEFAGLPCREALELLLEATVALAERRLGHVTGDTVFNRKFIWGLLVAEPLSIEQIVDAAFDRLGYNLYEIYAEAAADEDPGDGRRKLAQTRLMAGIQAELEDLAIDGIEIETEKNLDEEQDEKKQNEKLMESARIIGMSVDRILLVPLGHYLKVIRPLYEQPVDVAREIEEFLHIIANRAMSIYVFCETSAMFRLTKLGQQLLGLDRAPDGALPMPEFACDMFEEFDGSGGLSDRESLARLMAEASKIMPVMLTNMAYGLLMTFKVWQASAPARWMHLQIYESASLHELYLKIADSFELRPTMEYTFFHDKVDNPFAEYPSEARAERMKNSRKNTDTDLRTLCLGRANRHLSLVAFNQGRFFSQEPSVQRFGIELLKMRDATGDEDCPRVLRMSRAMEKWLESLEE